MAIKVYNKRGNTTLKEKRMVEQISDKLAELLEENPDYTFTPANTPAELEKLYNEICVDEVEFQDVKDEPKSAKQTFKEDVGADRDSSEKVIDPFNRDEPIIRDYVLQEEFPDENNEVPEEGGGTYEEPRTFSESFEIPEAGEAPAAEPTKSRFQGRGGGAREEDEGGNEPMNPAFDQMDSAKQRKKTKRFAKQIVSLTCDLLEKGFEWYTMRDITEAKLTEYEINDEMDLSILLDMPNGQQATVKEFFLSQHEVIRQESKIDAEDRDDLVEALTEVFLEKGIAPTPMQELMLVGARIVGMQVIKAIAITSSNNSVLGQLRAMKKEMTAYENYEEPNMQEPPRPTSDTTFTPPPAGNPQRQNDFQEMFPAERTIE
jgi:hypothetical protein